MQVLRYLLHLSGTLHLALLDPELSHWSSIKRLLFNPDLLFHFCRLHTWTAVLVMRQYAEHVFIIIIEQPFPESYFGTTEGKQWLSNLAHFWVLDELFVSTFSLLLSAAHASLCPLYCQDKWYIIKTIN